MRKLYFSAPFQKCCLFAMLAINFLPGQAQSQQLKITDFSIFGTNTVQIGSSSKVLAGAAGSRYSIKTNSNVSIAGALYSGENIQLGNSNKIYGNVSAANSSASSGYIFTAGSGAFLDGNIDVNGNSKVTSGTITGKLTHPSGTTYQGPQPGGGNIVGTPTLPTLPIMPTITNFPAAGSTNITGSKTISPGAYGNMNLPGKKTITFSGPGVYVFKSIKNWGLYLNNFVFDFKNKPGAFKIYVYNDVDLNISNIDIINGGGASRIYLETHGSGSSCSLGSYAFTMTNWFGLGRSSEWFGTVYAPYAGINIGSGASSSKIKGALWSTKAVNLQYGVELSFDPFVQCSIPDAEAGPQKELDCTVTSLQLEG
ncbi:MAG TPA: hypothetical protein VFV68_17230, partial [Agriterribacter sp.]|nr:hypothetical protein [Agriterribacter sp.]